MSSPGPQEPAEKDIADESIITDEPSSGNTEEQIGASGNSLELQSPVMNITPKSSRPSSGLVLDLSAISNGSTTNPVRGIYATETDERDDQQSLRSNSASHSRLPTTGRATPITPITKEMQPWDLIEPPATNNSRQMRDVEEGRKFVFEGGQRLKRKIPKSSYYFGPPAPGSAYGTAPLGVIGLHHPREIVRIERDYTGGEAITQFAPIWPLELEGRVRVRFLAYGS